MDASRHKLIRKLFGAALVAFFATALLGPAVLERHLANGLPGGTAHADNLHTIHIDTPTVLFERPQVRLERAKVSVGAANGRALNNSELGVSLQNGSTAIVMSDAKLVLDQSDSVEQSGSPSQDAAAVLQAISAMSVKSLSVHDAKIMTKRKDGDAILVGRLNCELVRVSDMTVHVKGTFERFGLTLPFEVDVGDKTATGRLPIAAKLDGPVINARLSGEYVLGKRFGLLANSIEMSSTQAKQLLYLLSGQSVSGHGLEDFRAKGSLEWMDSTFNLQSAKVTLDGNEADGSVSVNVSGSRPLLEGTLAFSNLELAPYVRPLPLTLGLGSNVLNWSRWLIGDQTSGSLIKDIDADLRLSASSVTANGASLGGGAATLTLSDGKLLADLAELQLDDNATGDARVSVDLSGAKPRYEVRGTLESTDLSRLTTSLSGYPFVSGAGDLSLVLSAEGDTQEEFRDTLAGKGNLVMPDGGKLAVDIASLMSAAKSGASGWGMAVSGSTVVDSLEAKFQATGGVVTATGIEAQTATRQLQATGTVDISSQTIDMSLASVPKQPGATPKLLGDKVRISGPLLAPTITNDGPSKAALPKTNGKRAKL